jgi:hypothetical protein
MGKANQDETDDSDEDGRFAAITAKSRKAGQRTKTAPNSEKAGDANPTNGKETAKDEHGDGEPEAPVPAPTSGPTRRKRPTSYLDEILEKKAKKKKSKVKHQ